MKVMGIEIEKYWYVDSFSDENKRYKVCRLVDGTYTCSCPEWIYRRKECKHIEQIKYHLEVLNNDFGLIVFKEKWILQPIKSDKVKLLKTKTDRENRTHYTYIGVPLIPIDPPDLALMNKLYREMRKLNVPDRVIREYWKI
jgi:hypothetical protein